MTKHEDNNPDMIPPANMGGMDEMNIAGNIPMSPVDGEAVIVKQDQQKVEVKQSNQELPHNLEIEATVIGSILRNNKLMENVDNLTPQHFYAPENQIIYSWILKATANNQLASPKTLAHYADSEPAIKALGGKDYLAEIASDVISIININEYTETLDDLYVKRQLIGLGEDMVIDAYSNDFDVTSKDQIEKAEQSLYSLAENGEAKKGVISLGQALVTTIASAESAFQNKGGIVGVTTGLKDLDQQLGGLHKSDLLILAGRPAMGKTSLVTNIAFNAAKAYNVEVDENGKETKTGGVVLFFSLEMSADQLAGRIISEQAEIASDKIRRGDIDDKQFERLVNASAELADTQLYIDDTPGISVTAMRQKARRVKRQHGLDMIIVDYLQLLQGPAGKKFDNRVNEVSEITRSLKIIAKELEVPVIALSQLSRSVEQREDKRPMLSDLRESGSIEQDADVVMFIYRPEYYLTKASPEKRANETDDNFNKRVEEHNNSLKDARNVAEVIISKQRHGPVGTIKLFFNSEFTKFGDLDAGH
ncbi:MAG: replicative DNA helicase [Alphaproteobacteria bacterium]